MSASSAPRMAIIGNGELLIEGAPTETLTALNGKIWSKIVATDDELRALESRCKSISTHLIGGQHEVRVYSRTLARATDSSPSTPISKTFISSIFRGSRELARWGRRSNHVLGIFLLRTEAPLEEHFHVYLFFRLAWPSSFLSVASESFGPSATQW